MRFSCLTSSRTDPDSPRVRGMIEHYDQYDFGPDPEHFTDVVIYIRKTPN